tara:strand:+ start:302 stop:487 length:186 start_codon:yes stop_codon:yes gene_type:complete
MEYKTFKNIMTAVSTTIAITIFVFILNFILINLFLGCQTWDQDLWTDYNSCITLNDFINFL